MTKRLRVQLIGGPTDLRGYHVALPSYAIVDYDTGTMTAVVDVPDDCYPPAPPGKPETVTNDAKDGLVITKVELEHMLSADAFFSKKYRERVGQFTLDVK